MMKTSGFTAAFLALLSFASLSFGQAPLSPGDHIAPVNGIELHYFLRGEGPVCLLPTPEQASTSDQPVLMPVNYDNGHFTEDKQVTFRNFANMYAFALWQAGHPAFQPDMTTAKGGN